LPKRAPGLDAGESHAIGRAIEIGAALLADDLAARRYAAQQNLLVIGTLGVLVRAKRQGMLPMVRPLIERLLAGGHRLGATAIDQALKAASE
jgi:predicted nucleic acid-binding protein